MSASPKSSFVARTFVLTGLAMRRSMLSTGGVMIDIVTFLHVLIGLFMVVCILDLRVHIDLDLASKLGMKSCDVK
jgi:hypothetical protein